MSMQPDYTTDDASRRDLWILRTGHNPGLSVARETSSGGYYRAVGTPLPSEWSALSFPDLLASAAELVGFPLPREAAWSTCHGAVWRARLTSPVTVLEAFNGRIADHTRSLPVCGFQGATYPSGTVTHEVCFVPYAEKIYSLDTIYRGTPWGDLVVTRWGRYPHYATCSVRRLVRERPEAHDALEASF